MRAQWGSESVLRMPLQRSAARGTAGALAAPGAFEPDTRSRLGAHTYSEDFSRKWPDTLQSPPRLPTHMV